MTRETKIGLLVGLAFIIVIGILLSDHLSSSTQPPPARLTDAGERVRNGVATPSGTTAPPVTLIAKPANPTTVVPVEPIPTPHELRQPPVQFVEVGPVPATQTQMPSHPLAIGHEPHSGPVGSADQHRSLPMHAIEQVALQHNEPLVEVNRDPRQMQGSQSAQPAPATRGMEYHAQPNDTLSKLAGRFMGGNTPANREAIIRANPSLQSNPDLIIAGRLYIIPLPDSLAQPAAARQDPAPTPAQAPIRTENQNLYTAKDGDSLWKIAAEHLGDGTAWTQLKELNHDVLRGGDVIRPGMKLRLQ